MAELADALGSGLSGRKLVRVQVPPSAHLRIPAARQVSCFNYPVGRLLAGTGWPARKLAAKNRSEGDLGVFIGACDGVSWLTS